MIPVVLIVLGFALVAIGSVADLKWREVPDWSNYAGIVAALMIRLLFSLGTGSWSFITEGILGLASMWLLACGLFYLGQWGGGDSKLLMAMGAIFGLGLPWESVQGLLGPFLMNLLIFGGLWGGLWSVRLAVENRSKVASAYGILMKKASVSHAKSICYIVALTLLLGAFAFSSFNARFPLIVLAVTTITTFHTWGFAKSVENVCFVKDVPTRKLEEGDWIQHDVKVKGRRICGPKDLGVSREQIDTLISAGVKTVTIKEGVPFVPSFFLAYIATILAGNMFVVLTMMAV